MTSSARTSALQPAYTAGSLSRRIVLGVIATLALALTSHVVFPLPFTPVPFTLQPLAVLAVGLLLGPVDGTLAVLAYLAEGAAGLPVFSPTGPGGLLQLFGPTGGYLMADPVVALVAGFGARRFAPRAGVYVAALLSCAAATLILFTCGAAWLNLLHPMNFHAIWISAIAPFLPGEAVKIVVAAGIFRTLQPRLER